MTIQDLMRDQFASAKSLWRLVYISQSIVLLTSIGWIHWSSMRSFSIAAFISIAGPLAAFFLRQKAGLHYAAGEKARRLLVLEAGLGRRPTVGEIAALEADLPLLVGNLEPLPVGPYYDSKFPVGLRRLAHITQEAALYTRRLAKAAASLFGFVTVVGMLFACVFVIQYLQAPSLGDAGQVAKAFAGLMVFMAGGVFATSYSSFSSLARSAGKTFDRCEQLCSKEALDEIEVLSVVADYDCSLAKAPPIPGFLHWLLRGRLARLWQSFGGSAPAEPQPQ